jgi:hypothetical protein
MIGSGAADDEDDSDIVRCVPVIDLEPLLVENIDDVNEEKDSIIID